MLFLINVKNRGTIDNYNSATIDYKENSASVLTFTISKDSYFFNGLNKYIDKIEVINLNEEIIFTGRVLDVQKSMNDEGEFINTVTCESVLNYLVDVTVPVWNLYGGEIPKKAPTDSEGNVTVNDLLNKVLNEYNSGAIVPIKLGNVTVEGNVTLKTNRQTCLEVIMNGLINVFGGFIQIREEENIYYLDYLESAPLLNSMTPFQIGVNIQNISIQDKLNNLCTRLIAIGKTQSIQAVAINEELVKIYGVIDKVVQFKNITNIEELQEKANLEVENINSYVLNANIGALDLSYIDNDFNRLELYQKVQVICDELGYNRLHYVVSITLNLLQPFASTFSLNTNKATQIDQITQLIQQNNETNREMVEIHGTLEEKTSNVEFVAYQEHIEKELGNTITNESILEFEENVQSKLNTEFTEYKEELAKDLSNKSIVYGGFITNLKNGEVGTITLPNIFKSLNGEYQLVYSIANIQVDNSNGISSANIIEISSDKINGIFNLKAEIVSAELGETENAGNMSIMWLAIG